MRGDVRNIRAREGRANKGREDKREGEGERATAQENSTKERVKEGARNVITKPGSKKEERKEEKAE